MNDLRIIETTELLAELSRLTEENKRLRDELTDADLMCSMLEREIENLRNYRVTK